MSRCILLDSWLDAMSKEIDEKEEKSKKCVITGGKKCQ